MTQESNEQNGTTSVPLDKIVMRDELLLAGMLLNRLSPMSPHHVAAARERLGHMTDIELTEFVRVGRRA